MTDTANPCINNHDDTGGAKEKIKQLCRKALLKVKNTPAFVKSNWLEIAIVFSEVCFLYWAAKIAQAKSVHYISLLEIVCTIAFGFLFVASLIYHFVRDNSEQRIRDRVVGRLHRYYDEHSEAKFDSHFTVSLTHSEIVMLRNRSIDQNLKILKLAYGALGTILTFVSTIGDNLLTRDNLLTLPEAIIIASVAGAFFFTYFFIECWRHSSILMTELVVFRQK